MSAIAPVAKFPVIVGPTAGAKSALGLEVALALGRAEIVTADAFQIYRGMNIGTAKPPLEERRGVVHHLIDLREPSDPTPFTVHDWVREAERVIGEIRARGNTPVVVGGTHLYVKALLEGIFEGPGADESLRERLRARGIESLRAELARVDPEAASRIHANDERRTIRALEVFHLTGKPISGHQKQWDSEGGETGRTDCVLVGLKWPVEAINRRINARVKEMMSRGLLDETRALAGAGAFSAPKSQAREALGYKQLLEHLAGRCSLEDATEKIKIETRRFAKNQRTWLKRLRTISGSVWLEPEGVEAEKLRDQVVGLCQIPNRTRILDGNGRLP
jgi:tRNA dimethylallyltransferase